MSDAKHSPLPWRISDDVIEDADRVAVAQRVCREDAAIILRAINSHAALVGALRDLLRICSDLTPTHSLILARLIAAQDKARAALALAEKEST